MKQIIFGLLLLTTVSFTKAQQVMLTDFAGRPVNVPKENMETEGSAFYPETAFKKSTVFLTNRTFIKDIPIKIDLRDRKVFFINDRNEELVSVMPVKQIVFEDGVVMETGFDALGKIPAGSFFQVLDTGKITFLKYIEITYVDSKGYNSNTIVRQFFRKDIFLAARGQQLFALSTAEEVAALVPGKQKEIEGFMRAQIGKPKKQADFEKIVRYCNSLL